MLGQAVTKELAIYDPWTPTREEYDATKPHRIVADYVINCIGQIPQKTENTLRGRLKMMRINALFPKQLRKLTDAKIIQIATDCVYDGERGFYSESTRYSAKDFYGVTKATGEDPGIMNLRCSIVGPDNKSAAGLYEWVRQQPEGATVPGWIDHTWNGITTQAFARIVRAIIDHDLYEPGRYHIVPANRVSKYQLVKTIAEHTGRNDLTITPTITGKPTDRTLATEYRFINEALWQFAGYRTEPTIEQLIEEVHD